MGSIPLAELEESILVHRKVEVKVLSWKWEACLGVGSSVLWLAGGTHSLTRGGKAFLGCMQVVFWHRGQKSRTPPGTCASKLKLQIHHKTTVGVSHDPNLIPSLILLPSSAWASSQAWPLPAFSTPTPQQGWEAGGGFSRGLCWVGSFPRRRSEAGLSWRQLPQM